METRVELAFGEQLYVTVWERHVVQSSKKDLFAVFNRTVQLQGHDAGHIGIRQVRLWINDDIANLVAELTAYAFGCLSVQVERDGGLSDNPVRLLDGQVGVAARPCAVLLVRRFGGHRRVAASTVSGPTRIIQLEARPIVGLAEIGRERQAITA